MTDRQRLFVAIGATVLMTLALVFAVHAQNVLTYNFSAKIEKAGEFQLVLTPSAPTLVRRHLVIQNNNTMPTWCWVVVGNVPHTKDRAYVLRPGDAYQRDGDAIIRGEVWATCDKASDTLYIEVQ